MCPGRDVVKQLAQQPSTLVAQKTTCLQFPQPEYQASLFCDQDSSSSAFLTQPGLVQVKYIADQHYLVILPDRCCLVPSLLPTDQLGGGKQTFASPTTLHFQA